MSEQEVYEYDFKEGVLYKFQLTQASGVNRIGRVLATLFYYGADLSYKGSPILYVLDLTSGVSYNFNLVNKSMHFSLAEWLNERVPIIDGELDINSGNAIANWTVAEAINNLNSSLGDIDTVLDELHTYAQALVTGGATE